MGIEITHVRFGSTPKTHETIASYKWLNHPNGSVGSSDKPAMVEWVDTHGDTHVGTGASRVEVGVVREASSAPYLRTHADGHYNNNLLNLPEF